MFVNSMMEGGWKAMAKRRGNNEGTVLLRKKCSSCKKVNTSSETKKLSKCRTCGENLPDKGTWVAQVTLGVSPTTGRKQRPSFYGKTRKEAVDKMNAAISEFKNGVYIELSDYSLGDWLYKWLNDYKKSTLKQHTYESYESLIRLHIKPSLGKLPISKIQANQIQTFYNQKLRGDEKKGIKSLSSRMVRYMHAVIRQALEQAVKEGQINRNVADSTSPPVIKSKSIKPLSEEDLITFLRQAQSDRYFAAFLLAATTGLRRGELLGLTWDCVDLEKGIITVRRQLIPVKGGLKIEETTKSDSSKRSINLTDDAIRELKSHKKEQEEAYKLLPDELYQDNNLVFALEDGRYIEPRAFTKRFQRIIKKAGLSKLRLHDLRHTHASLLLARGIHPKIVQERLGHSSITITLDLYSHLTDNLQESAALSLNGLMTKDENKSELSESD